MGSVSGVSGAMIVLVRKYKVVAIGDHTYSLNLIFGIIRNSSSSDSSIMELIIYNPG